MPAVTQVILYADLPWPEQVLAEEVVRLTVHWQAVDGGEHARRDVELYMTTAEREKLLAGNELWLEAGHVPGGRPTAVVLGGHPSQGSRKTKSMRFGPDGGPNSAERRDYWNAWKAWADELGLMNKDGIHRVWETSTGSSGYHPIPVCEAFELHLQGREEEAMRKLGPYLPRERRAS